MARRREDHSKDHFDLLPFISIMMCTLGCLLLVTLSISALSIGPGVGEGWVPAQDGRIAAQMPILIEWDGTNATIHWSNQKMRMRINWSRLSRSQPGDSWSSLSGADRENLNKLLDEMANLRQTHYALFAVRPSGFGNFHSLANEFRSRKINIGYEPIEQVKPVRLVQEKPGP